MFPDYFWSAEIYKNLIRISSNNFFNTVW
jgi:hypothetical protein